ncbi:MAG TPA: class I SAM-dependent methyltransferase [Phycisphaerae bacterium]|nr:class I SAM-dependent methyltransferase [Phycisphaerae bacterium]
MPTTPTLSLHTGAKAWDTIWKWTWFTKPQWQNQFRKQKEGTRRVLASLLPKLDVRSVLDCSCGLGGKTILLAEMGYEVEGSDGSAFAVKRAAQLAAEQGHTIRFFRARWETLGQTAGRRYDCIYNDAFAWITTRRSLYAAAKGICSALNRGAKFVFVGAHQWSQDSDRSRLIEEQFEQEGPFEVLPLYERDSVRLTVVIAREKTPDGVLGSRVHIIDDHGSVRVEVARVLDACKWTWTDYNDVLRLVGFSELYSVSQKGVGPQPYILNVAVK